MCSVGWSLTGMPRPLSIDPDPALGQDRDVDGVAVAGQRLVDGVVDDLVDEVVQAALTGRADVHAGALAHGLEALEHGDGGRVVDALVDVRGPEPGDVEVGPDVVGGQVGVRDPGDALRVAAQPRVVHRRVVLGGQGVALGGAVAVVRVAVVRVVGRLVGQVRHGRKAPWLGGGAAGTRGGPTLRGGPVRRRETRLTGRGGSAEPPGSVMNASRLPAHPAGPTAPGPSGRSASRSEPLQGGQETSDPRSRLPVRGRGDQASDVTTGSPGSRTGRGAPDPSGS